MSDKIKIRVHIANRKYPLNINSANEEEAMRRAAQRINELALRFERDYAVSDKQDVLAMCALQFASALELNDIDSKDVVQNAVDRLKALNQLMEERLA